MPKEKINNILSYIGIFIIMAGACLFIYDKCRDQQLDQKEEIKIQQFFEEETTSTEEETTTSTVETKPSVSYNYIAVLEIPKINLKRGLVDPTSKYNNVNYNIQIIESSTMPNIENGNLILASHNGASYVSFFDKLSKLDINDKVYVYYNGIKYEYLISKYYETNKDGMVEIYRNQNKSTITLISCKKNTKDKQLVYIGYLNSEESY